MELNLVFQFIKNNLISFLSLLIAYCAYRYSKKIQKSRINCLLRVNAVNDNSGHLLFEINNLGPGFATSLKIFSFKLKVSLNKKLISKYELCQFKGPIDVAPNTKSSYVLSLNDMSNESVYYFEWDDLLFKKNRVIFEIENPYCKEIKGFKRIKFICLKIIKMKFKFRKNYF